MRLELIQRKLTFMGPLISSFKRFIPRYVVAEAINLV